MTEDRVVKTADVAGVGPGLVDLSAARAHPSTG